MPVQGAHRTGLHRPDEIVEGAPRPRGRSGREPLGQRRAQGIVAAPAGAAQTQRGGEAAGGRILVAQRADELRPRRQAGVHGVHGGRRHLVSSRRFWRVSWRV